MPVSIKTTATATAAATKPVRVTDEVRIAKAIATAHNSYEQLRSGIGTVASVRAMLTVNMVNCFDVGAFEQFTGNDYTSKLWLDYVSDNIDAIERANEDKNAQAADEDASTVKVKVQRNHDGAASIDRTTRAAMLSAHSVAYFLHKSGVTPKLGTKGEIVVPNSALAFLNRANKAGKAMYKELVKVDEDGVPLLVENTFTFDALTKTASAFMGRLKDKNRSDKDTTTLTNATKLVALLWKTTANHKLGYAPSNVIKAFDKLALAMIAATSRRDAMIAAKAAAKANVDAKTVKADKPAKTA